MGKMLNLASEGAHHNETMVNLVHEIEKQVLVWDKGKLQSFVDFGVLFADEDSQTALSKPFWLGVCGAEDTDILWTCPRSWRMPQVLRAIGAFASASEASKNGWNKEVPVGFSQHIFRINKIRGVLTIVKGASPVNCVTDIHAPGMPGVEV